MTAKILLGTNWKMNKSLPEAARYSRDLAVLLGKLRESERLQAFVIPPFTSIETMRQHSDGRFWVGAQNVHWADWGPYTGEISVPMLCEAGVQLVLLGHAERRQHFYETDELVNRKLHAVLKNGLRALLCVGEREEEKDAGIEREVLSRQLQVALQSIALDAVSRLMVAYEPVWAIGEAGTVANVAYISQMLACIRSVLGQILGQRLAASVPLLYGGSINLENAAEIVTIDEGAGLFVGRAAWTIEGFDRLISICLHESRRRETLAQKSERVS